MKKLAATLVVLISTMLVSSSLFACRGLMCGGNGWLGGWDGGSQPQPKILTNNPLTFTISLKGETYVKDFKPTPMLELPDGNATLNSTNYNQRMGTVIYTVTTKRGANKLTIAFPKFNISCVIAVSNNRGGVGASPYGNEDANGKCLGVGSGIVVNLDSTWHFSF